MKNLPTHAWTRFTGEFKERNAFVIAGGEPVTYWEWTRRVQKLAVGLMDLGFEPGTRIGIVARNSRDWLDLALAAWMVGGCVVALVPGRDRRETLKCLARSGAEWIASHDENALIDLRGQGDKLPAHLHWISFSPLKTLKIDNVFDLDTIESKGRYRAKRGALNDLAKRAFELNPADPALMVFEFEPGDDPHGVYFSGGKLAVMLEYLGADLMLEEGSRVAVLLSFGWFYGLLTAWAALLQGRTLAIAEGLSELSDGLSELKPTVLVCGPATIEGKTLAWRERVESAPEFLKEGDFRLGSALNRLGDKAAKKLLYEPVSREMGGVLERVYLVEGRAPDDVLDVLENAGMRVLGMWGVPEAGVSHIERPGAERRHSVGRPVQGYVCKLDGTKGDQEGEILLRSDVLFEGYWDEAGPRQVHDGYLFTGIAGTLRSGFLFLERPETTV